VFPGLCLGEGAGTLGAAQITRGAVAMLAKRYRLKIATWTVVREPGQPSPHRR